MDTSYYFAGYYVMRPRAIDFGADEGLVTQTTSACINQAFVDTWVFSWTKPDQKILAQVKSDFQIDDNKIEEIQAWADKKFEAGKLQWVDNFSDLETALEYKSRFFSHLRDVHIYSIYLSASDRKDLIEYFSNEQYNQGDFGLRQNLIREIKEDNASNESFLGFDLIGVEIDGGYHSFFCNGATQQLTEKFNLVLNENGLFDEILKPEAVKYYLNDERNGFEPVPWFIAKTKKVKD